MGNFISKCSKVPDDALETMNHARHTLGTAEPCLDTIKGCSTALTAISASCTAYQIWDETQSKEHLVKLGKEIADGVKQINESVNVDVNLNEPDKLSRHAYCMAQQHIEASSGNADCLFLFHPANNWHPEFKHRLKRNENDDLSGPLPDLCGLFDNIEAMAVILARFRQIVGDAPIFYILVPTAHVYVIPDDIQLPTELGKIQIIGQKARNQHPFVYLTGGEEWKEHVLDVGILSNPEAEPSLTPMDKVRKVAGATAAGFGGASAGSVAGLAFGPAGPLIGAVTGGTAAGVAAGDAIEKDRKDERRKEQAQKNAATIDEKAAMK